MSGPGLLRRRVTAAVAVAAAAALAFLPTTSAVAGTPTFTKYTPHRIPVQLLSFNDFHGHIEPDSAAASDSKVPFEGQQVVTNGAAYLSTHLKKLRNGHPTSFTVAAGDLIGASTFTSGVFQDEPTIEVMDKLGLDVSSVGNHEFDEGVTELKRMQYGGCHPVQGCFQQDAAGNDIVYPGAKFQYLAANVVSTTTGSPVLPRFWVQKVGPTKIGFIGLTLEGTDSLVSPTGVKGYDFTDEVRAGNAAAKVLQKKRGVKAIVVLVHEGGLQAGSYSGCTGPSGAIVDIAKRLAPKIDAIVSGHTHQPYVCNIPDRKGQRRLVTSAMSYGRIITETTFKIDTKTDDVVRPSLRAVNSLVTRDVPQDPAVRAIVDKWAALAAGPGNRVVGTISQDIKRGPTRGVESSLANTIADAQQASTGAQVAFMNPGGVRADLVYSATSAGEAPGQITYREAYNVQPFSNILQTFDMTGAQIDTLLEQQWMVGRAGGEVLRLGVSNGFSYAWSASAPYGNKIDPSSIKLNGVTLDPNASYRVAANNFIADGGDSFTAFVNGAPRTGGKIDLDALIDYFGANPNLGPAPATRSTQLP